MIRRVLSRPNVVWLVLFVTSISVLKTADAQIQRQIRRHPRPGIARLPNHERPFAPRPQARPIGLPGTNGAIMLYTRDRRVGMRSNAFGSAIQRTGQASDMSLTLFRPQLLLRDTGFMAPVRRYSPGLVGPSSLDTPTQEELDQAIESFMNVEPSEQDYSAILARRVRSQQQRYLRDGFGYLRDGDLIRAAGAFDAAESADRNHPYPRFGKLIIHVVEKHYARSTTRLATIMKYDSERPPGVPPAFEYTLTWRDYFEDDEDLRVSMQSLREFAQRRLDRASIQALYCYVLWYSGFEEARVEARNVAAAIARSHPKSTWAGLLPMILRAEESARGKAANADASVSQAQ